MVNYKIDTEVGTYIPFVRWSYFDGARKFASVTTRAAVTAVGTTTQGVAAVNLYAPSQNVNEIDFGIEYQPWPSFEVTAVYTHAFQRTNTSTGGMVKDVDRVTLQLQFNY
jgi:hypothetical protein